MESKKYILDFIVEKVQKYCKNSNVAISYCFRNKSYSHLICIENEENITCDDFYREISEFVINFEIQYGEEIIFTKLDSGLCSIEEWEKVLRDDYIILSNKVYDNIDELFIASIVDSTNLWLEPKYQSNKNNYYSKPSNSIYNTKNNICTIAA